MANSFAKEERVAFDQVFEAFEDALVMSNLFNKYLIDDVTAERTSNAGQFWRPMPYIAQSFTGVDQSSNFARNYTQLVVPANLGYSHSVPLTLSSTELRDALQQKKLGNAAMQRLASDINVDCSNLAALTGTVWSKRTVAATGFDDVAVLDTAFNRNGIPMNDRYLALSTGDYNNMASNLAARTLGQSAKSLNAYEKAFVGDVAGFKTYKLDYAYRLTAAAGVTVAMGAANQRYVPKSMSTATTGETSPVDNRYQVITITVGSGTVKVGDVFTIAGVNECHHITKQSTGVLKTFRVTGIVTGAGGSGTIQISPPIICADSSPTDPEIQYQNCVGLPGATAVITFLNTVTAAVNPLWQADAFEIIPGHYRPQEDAGMAVMSATTENGISVTMTRQGSIGDLSTKYRWDVFYGLVNKQPEMTGGQQFSQT